MGTSEIKRPPACRNFASAANQTQFFVSVQQGSRLRPSFSLLRPLGFRANALRIDEAHDHGVQVSDIGTVQRRACGNVCGNQSGRCLRHGSPAAADGHKGSAFARGCCALQLVRPLCRRASRLFVGPHACRRRRCRHRAQRTDRRHHRRRDDWLQLADRSRCLRPRGRFRLDERARRRHGT